jgi:anti-sigma B factor antagonist
MRISTQNYNTVTVVDLQGELDGDLADSLKNTVSEIVSRQQTGIVLNMSDIGFIDSQGLELLLWVQDYCRRNRTQFKLAALDENCEKILEITRLENEFDCHAELAEAVKSFA